MLRKVTGAFVSLMVSRFPLRVTETEAVPVALACKVFERARQHRRAGACVDGRSLSDEVVRVVPWTDAQVSARVTHVQSPPA